MTGEARHRRSRVYDLAAGTQDAAVREQHDPHDRPEYIWLPARTARRS